MTKPPPQTTRGSRETGGPSSYVPPCFHEKLQGTLALKEEKFLKDFYLVCGGKTELQFKEYPGIQVTSWASFLVMLFIQVAMADPCGFDSALCWDVCSQSWVSYDNANACGSRVDSTCGQWTCYGICVINDSITQYPQEQLSRTSAN